MGVEEIAVKNDFVNSFGILWKHHDPQTMYPSVIACLLGLLGWAIKEPAEKTRDIIF